MKDKLYKIWRNVPNILRGLSKSVLYNIFYSGVHIGNQSRWSRNIDMILHPGCKCYIGDYSIIGKCSTIAVLKKGTLSIGNHVGIGDGCHIVCHENISIGNYSILGPNVMVYDHNHKYNLNGVAQKEYETGVITIGKNTWIGANCTILKNVHIGNNCVVGAGSVVTKDVPDGAIVGGVPAKELNKK